MKIIIILFIFLIIWLIGSWITIRNIEEPKYDLLSKNKIYEIRKYEPYIIAQTVVSGSYEKALNQGFRNIADYIFGNNTIEAKIAMTTPVTEKVSEKIAMTVPVIDKNSSGERTVSFVMPSKYTLETIPKPNSNLVTLQEVSETKKAVLRYGWYTNEKKVEQKKSELLEALQEDGIEIIGEFSSARYNPPLSMPLLLRNEILVEVR